MNLALSIMCAVMLLSGCSEREVRSNTYCENELLLISNFNAPAKTGFQIHEVRKSPVQSVLPFLENPSCDQVTLNYLLPLERRERIDLSLTVLYSEDCILPPFTPRYICHIFIGTSDTLLIEQEWATRDMVAKKVYEFYKQEGSMKTDLVNYKHVHLSFLWGEEANAQLLNKTMEASIDGYLLFADSLSHTNFTKSICQLDKEELASLHELIPFQFRTDFMMGFEGYDFIGRRWPAE